MAMSHVQSLVLLLASLFFLPALYAIKFEYCNNNVGYGFGNVTDVKVTTSKDADTSTTIYVSVDAKKSLEGGSATVYVTSGESEPTDGRMYDFYEVVDTFPLRADTHVLLTFAQVPLQNELMSYDKVIITLYGEDLTEEFCINFNPYGSTTSASVSA